MKKIINLSIILVFWMVSQTTFGQTTHLGNDPLAPVGSFLGWNHARDLNFNTNNINRMRLMQTGNVNVNQGAFAQDGFLSLSSNPSYLTPWTLLHLNGDNAGAGPYSNGHRNWMRYGLSITCNGDFMCQESKLLKFIDLRCSRPPMPSGI